VKAVGLEPSTEIHRADGSYKLSKTAILEADRSAVAAEVYGSRSIADLVAQQRLRGRKAKKQSGIILFLLVITILIGIIFYLFLPFWKQFVDGRRNSLHATLVSVETNNASLDSKVMHDIEQLKTLLKEQAVTIPAGEGNLSGFVVTDEATLIYGDRGILLRSFDGGRSFSIFDPIVEFDLSNHYQNGNSIVIYGADEFANPKLDRSYADGILISNDNGRSFEKLTMGRGANFVGHFEYADRLFLFGWRGALAEGSVVDRDFRLVESGVTQDINGQVELGDSRMLYGSGESYTGTYGYHSETSYLVSENAGEKFSPLIEYPHLAIDRHAVSGKSTFLIGRRGDLIQFSGGSNIEKVFRLKELLNLTDIYFDSGGFLAYGTDEDPFSSDAANSFVYRLVPGANDAVLVHEASGIKISGHIRQDDFLLLFGSKGSIFRSSDDGLTFEPIASGVNSDLRKGLYLNGNIIIYGDDGTVTGSFDKGITFQPQKLKTGDEFRAHSVSDKSIVIFSYRGTVIQSEDGGRNFRETLFKGLRFNGICKSDNFGQFLFGQGAQILRSTNNGEDFQSIPIGADVNLHSCFDVDNGIIFLGSDGALVRFSDDLSTQIGRKVFNSAIGLENQILKYLDSEVPKHIGDLPELDSIRRDLLSVGTQRRILSELQREAEAEIRRLDSTPFIHLLREQQFGDFERFLSFCRGSSDAAATSGSEKRVYGELTSACLNGWTAHQNSTTQAWWETLAEQLPPGVLLLFLLSILGGLYRYNLRLSGFHHSRADLLELISFGRGPDFLISSEELSWIVQASETLAADKVEFRASSAPSDQAVEVLKAFLARK